MVREKETCSLCDRNIDAMGQYDNILKFYCRKEDGSREYEPWSDVYLCEACMKSFYTWIHKRARKIGG